MTRLQQLLRDNPAVAQIGPKWLAEHVGGVSVRTWLYWVNGRDGKHVEAPDDAVQAIQLVVQLVQTLADVQRPARRPGVRKSNPSL